MKKTATVTSLRQPTREQKRQIMGLLEVCYDTAAERYKSGDTDKTVSETLGRAILPGWVAAIREEHFGPEGENEEMAALAEDLRKFTAAGAEALKSFREAMEEAEVRASDLAACVDQVKGMARRLDGIRASVGPKAG